MKNIEPEHIGDGLYFLDKGYNIEIAVNHHLNVVAYLDIVDIYRAISYLKKVRNNGRHNKV